METRILIIDDEPLLRHSLDYLLSQAEYSVAATGNGDEALKYLDTGKFELVILDSKIPNVESLSLLQHLRETRPHTKAVIFTTDSRTETIQRAFQSGADAFLIKPLDPEILLEVISDLLHGRPVKKAEGVVLRGEG